MRPEIRRALYQRASMALLFCLPGLAVAVYRDGIPERILASVWILACGIFALDSENGWYLASIVALVVVLLCVVWLPVF